MLITGGDFNARIGKEGKLYNGELEEEREKRNSKDSAINEEGEKMLKLVEERGWHILNGNVKGDKTEEFTYVEKQGATVIDYVMTNNTGLDDRKVLCRRQDRL